MDGSVSEWMGVLEVFREKVFRKCQKWMGLWMGVFRNGVSERCFGTWMGLFDVDGTVSVWCFGISGILVFRCIGASVFELHSSVAVV